LICSKQNRKSKTKDVINHLFFDLGALSTTKESAPGTLFFGHLSANLSFQEYFYILILILNFNFLNLGQKIENISKLDLSKRIIYVVFSKKNIQLYRFNK